MGDTKTTGKKLNLSKHKKSSPFHGEIHSKPDFLSNKKDTWTVSGRTSSRCIHSSVLKHRRTRRKILNEEATDSPKKISRHIPVKDQGHLQLLANKLSCKNNKAHSKLAANDGAVRLVKRRRRRKKKKHVDHDEASRLQKRTRYLLIKMKQEQNLIDAYSGDGWNGQSREKIRPEKELLRAKKQIMKCKLGIRDAIHQLDAIGSAGGIQDNVMHPEGSVSHKYPICSKCKSSKSFPGNDIIQCDGTCDCCFHQKCLVPPLEKVPPADHPWLCRFCECRFEILEAINAHLGTCFTVKTCWEEIFKEATAFPDNENACQDPVEEWPSEDSADEDYNPEMKEHSNSGTNIAESTSEDLNNSSSLACSSDEDRSYSGVDHQTCRVGSFHDPYENKNDCNLLDLINIDFNEISDCEIINRRRQRSYVDYKKLHDEMFGKEPAVNETQSEDEDWGPKRRKRRKMESDPVTNITNCAKEDECLNSANIEKKSHGRRQLFRIPADAVEKLRLAFAENQLPSRAVKEHLSKQLDISPEKVSKWFKNARYAALRMRKTEIGEHHQTFSPSKRSVISHGSDGSSHKDELIDSSCLLPLSSIIRVPKKLRRILVKKFPEPATTTLNNQQNMVTNTDENQTQKTKMLETHFSSTSVNGRSSKEVNKTAPRHSNGSKRKTSAPKAGNKRATVTRVNGKKQLTKSEQLYLAEFERIHRLQSRLQALRKALESGMTNDLVQFQTHSSEQIVIYVPVAEVKEKNMK